MMCDYTFFTNDPSQWDESYQSLLGCHNICPLLKQFHVTQVTQPELFSLTHLQTWDDSKRFCSDVAFLMVLLKRGCCRREGVWAHYGVGSPLPSQGFHYR